MSRVGVKLRDRFLAGILSAVMIFNMIPGTTLQALAATETYPDDFTVTVKDEEGVAISDAVVKLYHDFTDSEVVLDMSVQTDDNGTAVIKQSTIAEVLVNAGKTSANAELTVSKDGYKTKTNSVDVNAVEVYHHDISLVKEEKSQVTVSVTVIGDATVEINNIKQNSVTVEAGTEVPVKITPVTGSYIRTLTIGGEDIFVAKGKAYEGTIKADSNIAIIGTIAKEFTVSAPAVEGGVITLNGSEDTSLTVDDNARVVVGVTADEGYRISSVAIDGEAQNIDNDAVFSTELTITADTKISVVFAKVYTITVTHNSNGTVVTEPAIVGGSVTIVEDSMIKIIVDPDDNYRIAEVKINDVVDENITGANYGTEDKYIKELTADMDYTVVITFAPNRYNVTAEPVQNGTIAIGSDLVEHAGSSDIIVTPDNGYSVNSIKVNGETVGMYDTENGVVSFTITNITEVKKVEASFIAVEESNVDVKELFNDEVSVHSNGMTFVYSKNDPVVFNTDKEGIILYDKSGQIIGGGKDVQSVTINTTTEIAKIELVYKANEEMVAMPHNVVGISQSSILKIVIDTDKTESVVTPDDTNINGFYNDDFNVKLETEDFGDFSGIASIEYFITSTEVTGEYDEIQANAKTESGIIYSYVDTVENKKEVEIPVTAAKNDSDTVIVWAKITDRAGNVETIKTDVMKVCVTAPKLASVVVSGTKADDADDGYFNVTRTATITIVDRASAFDETSATNGIEIIAQNFDGGDVVISKPAMISWVHNGDNHVATIAFETNANYKWSLGYTNKADLLLDKSGVIETGDNIYEFTVDGKSPVASISIDTDNVWDEILSAITFGIWQKDDITASATADDEVAGVKEIVYYKSDLDIALTETELEKLYNSNEFVVETYTVSEDEKFTVYARITDKAGNTRYVSTDGLVYDCSESVISFNSQDENANGIYNKDVKIDVLVNEVIEGKAAYSGIKTIDYKVIKDNDEDNPTQFGNLYTFDVENPEYSELMNSWTGEIIVDAKLNNSDNVKVIVTAVDNAGNENIGEISLAINCDVLEAVITLDGTANMVVGDRGYYGMAERVATITITDRVSSFDEVAATAGVVIKDDKDQVITSGYTISSWIHDGDKHTATITFSENGNYVWSYSYINSAGNILDVINKVSTGTSETPFVFTVDDLAPTGTITVKENTWDKILKFLTFGIFSNEKVDVRATYADDTSPVTVEYYKVSNIDAPILLSKELLDELYEKGKFSTYTDFSVDADEQFVVYLRITDYAGNYTYINSDGAIVDSVPSEIVITPESFDTDTIYGCSYEDGINVAINVTDAEPYSGIKSIDYRILKDNDSANPTQAGNLYTFDNPAPMQFDLVNRWSGNITINPNLNNSSNVVVCVTVVDNAGNISENSKVFDIDVTKPTIQISFNDITANKVVEDRGYFAGQREATIQITERTSHFDENDAIRGIVINAVDANNEEVQEAYTIGDWTTKEGLTPDEAVHTARVTFREDANYTWSISYSDKAGNLNEVPDIGESITPYKFTVDTVEPTGIVMAETAEGRKVDWESLRENLTFGIWSKSYIDITGTFDDKTSKDVDKVEYYKLIATSATDATTPLRREQLDSIGTWSEFTSLRIEKDEQFTVYFKITDLAGNYSYISTNGLIVDHNAPIVESVAPEIRVEPEQPVNGIYNGDVKVDIKVIEPMVGGTYSGINKIWYEVKNLGEVTQSGNLYTFNNLEPLQSDLINNWTGSITVDSKLNNSNDVKIIVYAQDNSGNGSDKDVAIKIDITKPTILVSYDNNASDSSMFFKNDRTATVVISERNFDPKDVIVTIDNTDGIVPIISEFTCKEGTGNKDNEQWIATIKYTADGDYTFDIAYTDLAKNVCDGEVFAEGTVASNEFTIDKTNPVISVSYDNNDVQNGNYYKSVRTATIVITEHNFNSERVEIINTANDDGIATTKPTISRWSSSGNKHTATIHYGKDAKYTFDIVVKDKAGNTSADYSEETFFVDTTMPALTITGVANNSANNGDVIPVVSYSDTNYDPNQVAITLTGANRKDVELDGSYIDEHNGRTFTFNNFAEKKEIDDIYTLTAELTDKAGNTTTETIMFSVNRFGSTYAMSESAEKLNGTYVKETSDVVVTETNANELKNIKITLFKNNETIVLTEGEDYKIDVLGGNGAWYHYTYTVFAKNFVDDGVYRLTFHSEDIAGNVAENTLDTKDTEISFGVDATMPNIVVANLENGITYALENMTINMSVSDNLFLNSIKVYLDDYDKVYKEWNAEEISDIVAENGDFTFDIAGNSKSAHKAKIVAIDAAGNEQVVEITDFFVTTDMWVRYYNNDTLFFGSIAGVIVFVGLIVFLVVYKRKKETHN